MKKGLAIRESKERRKDYFFSLELEEKREWPEKGWSRKSGKKGEKEEKREFCSSWLTVGLAVSKSERESKVKKKREKEPFSFFLLSPGRKERVLIFLCFGVSKSARKEENR